MEQNRAFKSTMFSVKVSGLKPFLRYKSTGKSSYVYNPGHIKHENSAVSCHLNFGVSKFFNKFRAESP